MATTEFPCLICYDPATGVDAGTATVTEQDFTLFTFRCFLQLDKHWFDKHWTEDKMRYAEIRLCNTCRKGVEQAKAIYDELVEMAKKFREKQKEAVDKIRASSPSDSHSFIAIARRISRRHQTGNKESITEVVRQVILEGKDDNFQGPLLIDDWKGSDISSADLDAVPVKKEEVELNQSDAEEGDTMMNLSTLESDAQVKPQDDPSEEVDDADGEMEWEQDSSAESASEDADDNADDDKEWSGAEELEVGKDPLAEESDSGPGLPGSKIPAPPKRKRIRKRISSKSLMDTLGEEGVPGFKRLAFGRVQSVQCPFCDVQGVHIGGIARHVRNAHPSDYVKYLVKIDNSEKYPKKFSCCEKVFHQWIKLYEHLGEKHEVKPLYVCDLCPEEFSTEYLLRCHAFKVHNRLENVTTCGKGNRELAIDQKPVEMDESLRCQTCGKVWKNIRSLHLHMANMHGFRFEKHPKRKFPCPQPNCDRTFNSKENADAHFARDHKKEFLFHCDLCGAGFHIKKALVSHQETKHSNSNTQVICELCGKSFRTNHMLYCHRWEMHRRDRNQKKTPKVCDLCGKTFTSRQGFQAHQATTHNINVKYSCHVCAQPFSSRTLLEAHLYSKHNIGEPSIIPKPKKKQTRNRRRAPKKSVPEICDLCGKTFASSAGLHSHRTTTHNINVKYSCHVCAKPFPANVKLKIHLYSKHKIGERPPGMKKITETLKFQCQLYRCKLRFAKQETLDKHVKEVHGNCGTGMPFNCRFCGKGFSGKFKHEQHEMIHTNKETRPFRCEICGKGFVNQSNLRYHELNTHKAERKYKYPEKKPVSEAE